MTRHFVEADYTPSPLQIYRGNPLIEALPDFTSRTTRSVADALRGKVSAIHDTATRRQKNQWLGNLASEMFVPLSRHIKLHELIDLAIRQGYAQARPMSDDDVRRMNEAYKRQQKGERLAALYPSEQDGAPVSISVIGCSGIGKTYGISRLLRLYPQVISHPQWAIGANFLQIVYLRVECPSNGSIKAMCSAIISEVDRVTGENFHDLYVKHGKVSAEILKSRVAHLLAVYHVGLLVIDEIQNLALSRTDREILFNFIVSLSNSLCVPLLFIGTPKVQRFMQSDLRISRRFGTLGSVLLTPLDRNKPEWRSFVIALWQNNILESSEQEIPETVENALFDCSQGITDILVKLFLLTQKYVLVASASTQKPRPEAMTADDVYAVFDSYFANVRPMIEALRKGDVLALEKYQDITFPTEDFEKASGQLTEELDRVTEKEDPEPSKVEGTKRAIRRMLPPMGVAVDAKVDRIIEEVLTLKPDSSLPAAMAEVLARLTQATGNQPH